MQFNKDILLSPLILNFIYQCNAIEGTFVDIKDIEYIIENFDTFKDKHNKFEDEDIKEVVFTTNGKIYCYEHGIETVNLIKAVNYVLNTIDDKLSHEYIKELHKLCRQHTIDEIKSYNIGEYKSINNIVGNRMTTDKSLVTRKLNKLFKKFNSYDMENYDKNKKYTKILEFHIDFEKIHPFQDGNGRVGRLIMLKQCMQYLTKSVPLVIFNQLKYLYYPLFDFAEFDKHIHKEYIENFIQLHLDILCYEISSYDRKLIPKEELDVMHKVENRINSKIKNMDELLKEYNLLKYVRYYK